jgi:uncharacterized protein YciW
MLAYAERLTRDPSSVSEDDIYQLRATGWSDRAIHDIAQVIAYYNYVNRVADGLGVTLEQSWPEHWPE